MDIFFIIWSIVLFIWALLGIYNSVRARKQWTMQGKYLCIPCWFIYDPALWDPDSGIAPWTAFEDIPDDWQCPVCGVTKADFIPLWWNIDKEITKATIVKHIFINKTEDVLLLKIQLPKKLDVKPWQYFSFVYQDDAWEFRRSYSVVKVKGDIYTFLIRIEKPSRWWEILKKKKVGDTLDVYGVFWNFSLQSTEHKKVFIGTGTGLAPLFHMLQALHSKDNMLLFWSKNMEDIFYLEELSLESVKNVQIYLSREEKIPENFWKILFKKWRLNLEEFFKEYPEYNSKETEFYLCGNPNLVHSVEEYLQKNGFERVYTEKF